jgi:hypothetical protein
MFIALTSSSIALGLGKAPWMYDDALFLIDTGFPAFNFGRHQFWFEHDQRFDNLPPWKEIYGNYTRMGVGKFVLNYEHRTGTEAMLGA